MGLQELEQFFLLCRVKSISQAARELYLTQQGLSKIVQRWERELDAPLFIRTRSGLELTECGKVVQTHAQILFHQYAALKSALHDAKEERGEASPAASPAPLSIFSEVSACSTSEATTSRRNFWQAASTMRS